MKCQHQGCHREATHVPKLMVPAMGWPLDAHTPMSAIIAVKLCKRHCRQFPPVSKQTPELRDVFAILARGKVPPDFERSFIEPLALDSAEYAAYEKVLTRPKVQ